MPTKISDPLTLPISKRVVPNRFSKAATTECLANPQTKLPNSLHNQLYKTWGGSGCGMVITGNIMVDPRYLESPRNVALHDGNDGAERKEKFVEFAEAIHHYDKDTLAIVQLSHPGRQCPVSVTSNPIAPSAVDVQLPGLGMMTKVLVRSPRAMTAEEIDETIKKIARSAALAEEYGFDGVQLHAAHGYLISQFLSPLTNQRTDAYGGSSVNRRKFLLDAICAVRKSTKPNFVVGVKINSEDFKEGGFNNDESMELIDILCSSSQIDFIELSGGTYENMESMKNPGHIAGMKASTLKREGFFLDFAERVVKRQAGKKDRVPLMLTGGFRTRKGIESALSSQVDLIGLARPLCVDPTFPKRLLENKTDSLEPYQVEVRGFLAKTLTPGLNNLWHQRQIELIANGEQPDLGLGFVWALTAMFLRAYYLDPEVYVEKEDWRGGLGGTVGVVGRIMFGVVWEFVAGRKTIQ